MKQILIIVAFLACSVNCFAQQSTGKAQKIIDRMRQAYRTAQTYQDEGEVVTVFHYKDPKPYMPKEQTTKLTFSTAFSRPTEQFRFIYFAERLSLLQNNTMLIASTKGKTQRYWTLDKALKTESSLSEALATAAGVSGTSSRRITSFLFNDLNETGLLLQRMTDLHIVGNEKVDQVVCHKFQGHLSKIPVTFWVDTQTFLIRKIVDVRTHSDFTATHTMIIRPILNQSIPSDALAFDYEKYQ